MKRMILLIPLLAAVLLLTGCATVFTVPVRPPMGVLITNYKAPLTVNFHETPVCTKRGVASTLYFRDFLLTGMDFGWGEAGIDDAAKNGNLKTVEYADYEMLSVLGVFGKFTVVARGT